MVTRPLYEGTVRNRLHRNAWGTAHVGQPETLTRRRWGGPGGVRTIGAPGGGAIVGTFEVYADAERAVDQLVAQGFRAGNLAISGTGLSSVEPDAEPAPWVVAVLRAVAAGALFGVVLGLLFGFVGLTDPIVSGAAVATWGAALGAGAGGLSTGVGWLVGTASADAGSRIEATCYQLLCTPDETPEARRLLATGR